MTLHVTQPGSARPRRKAGQRKFEVGTTGWTADDLNDARIESCWDSGRYEIVEGVLTRMAAAYLDGSLPLAKLRREVERHLDREGRPGDFTHEVDFIVGRRRIAKPDMIFTTPDDLRKQADLRARLGPVRPKIRFGRLLVPPTLVVESVSSGHEDHDKEVKRRWYADVKVPNYWLLNPYTRELECLVLDANEYKVDVSGKNSDEVRPALFQGLSIRLGELWLD